MSHRIIEVNKRLPRLQALLVLGSEPAPATVCTYMYVTWRFVLPQCYIGNLPYPNNRNGSGAHVPLAIAMLLIALRLSYPRVSVRVTVRTNPFLGKSRMLTYL
jgi:hypothetical protein